MPFIRLSDDYIDHEKFLALSDRAFRLWHEGLAYCRKHQTDGRITRTALKHFKYVTRVAVNELATTQPGEGGPLWEAAPEGAWMVRNYLTRNRSKEEDDRVKAETAKRVGNWRSNRVPVPHSLPPVTPLVTALQPSVTNGLVLDRRGEDLKSSKKQIEIGERAAALLDNYARWYSLYRHGAKLRLIRNTLEFSDALQLVELWDDTRLEKLARVVLTSDDPYIADTDRSFKIFAMKASWADDRLSAAERSVAS